MLPPPKKKKQQQQKQTNKQTLNHSQNTTEVFVGEAIR